MNLQRLALGSILMVCAALQSGCAGFARGVTEAIIGEPGAKEDTKKCYVRGRAFVGLEDLMKRQEQAVRSTPGDSPVLKVLMVHGIGSHQPGYSTRLAENLARSLSLTRVEEHFKEIALTVPRFPNQELGVLRFTRYLNANGTREMIFAELTWDPIVEQEKRTIAFDDSGEYSFRRTPINNTLKLFVNSTVPDVLMYNGTSRQKIAVSVGQSLCWLMSNSWGSLPAQSNAYCDGSAPESLDRIGDDYVFITHSLGSRITVDALQFIATTLSDAAKKYPSMTHTLDTLREKEFTVFMLSNQLPLLQLGQSKPEQTNRIAEFCGPAAPHEKGRIFRETRLIAFSDPNDLFSYAVPPRFLDEYVDSRICPSLTNVILNVAEVSNVFGNEYANPMSCHTEYDNDRRVIGLLSGGIGGSGTDPEVAARCSWLEAIPTK